MIAVQCESCKSTVLAPDNKAGQRRRCPNCGADILIPGPSPEVVPAKPIEQPDPPAAPVISSPGEAGDLETPKVAMGQDLEAAPTADLEECPSCHYPADPPGDRCERCGIHLPSCHPIFEESKAWSDAMKDLVDLTIRGISWVIPLGIYPIYSEGKGKSQPLATWTIASLTIIISIFLWKDPSTLLSFALWNGSGNITLGDISAPVEYQHVQLLTYMFMHEGWGHLLGNMIFLVVLGTRVNAVVGNGVTPLLYLGMGVAAALAQLLSMSGGPLGCVIGASGAIMGMAGMDLVLFPADKVHLAAWIRIWTWWRRVIFALPGYAVVLFYIAFDAIHVMEKGVAHWAHIGGLAAGMLVGLIMLATRLAYTPGNAMALLMGKSSWAITGSPAWHQERTGT